MTKTKKQKVWDKTGGVCWYCGDTLDFGEWFHPDHVTPRARGGTNELSNLAPCCPTCNHKKHALDIEGFRDVMSRKPGYLWFSKKQKQWIQDIAGVNIEDHMYGPRYVFWFEKQAASGAVYHGK